MSLAHVAARSLAAMVLLAALLGIGVLGVAAGKWMLHSDDAAGELGGFSEQSPGPIDVGFSQAMLLHHEQVVSVSRVARDRLSPKLREVADSVIHDQGEEIGQMKGWLALWREPLGATRVDMRWMVAQPGSKSFDPAFAARCSTSPGGMPGLVSKTQMEAMRQAQGAQVVRLFLELMLAFHMGAKPVAAYAAEHAESVAVRELARAMDAAQERAGALLRTLLDARSDIPVVKRKV